MPINVETFVENCDLIACCLALICQWQSNWKLWNYKNKCRKGQRGVAKFHKLFCLFFWCKLANLLREWIKAPCDMCRQLSDWVILIEFSALLVRIHSYSKYYKWQSHQQQCQVTRPCEKQKKKNNSHLLITWDSFRKLLRLFRFAVFRSIRRFLYSWFFGLHWICTTDSPSSSALCARSQ